MSGVGAAGDRDARDPGLALYRALLRLYPRRFRDRHAPGLEEAFLLERRAGHRGPAALWSWLLRDAISAALSLRFRSPSRGPVPPGNPRPRGFEMLVRLLSEIRHAVRALVATPGFSVVAILILAVGIGSITVVFAVVDAVFLRPPAEILEPSRLVRLTTANDSGGVSGSLQYPDFEFLRDGTTTLAGTAAFDDSPVVAALELPESTEPVPAEVRMVSGNYFDVLGVPMAAGRSLGPEDRSAPGEGAAVVLEFGFWRTAFGADESAIGSTVRLNGHPFTVVGVAVPGFRGTGPLDPLPDLWAPLTMQPTLRPEDSEAWLRRVENTNISWLTGIGRLAPGVGLEQARAEFDRMSEQLIAAHPDVRRAHLTADFSASPAARDSMVETSRLLAGAVGMVLLIVCANVAVLQLARASARRREVAIRSAIGASRGQILRQALLESGLLALVGGCLGFAGSFWGVSALRRLMPVQIFTDMQPDLKVLGFSLLIALPVALLFGLGPALGSARTDVVRAIQSRAVVGGNGRLRAGLVVAQVALSVVLLLGAALFLRSLAEARGTDPGFTTERLAIVTLRPASHGLGPEEQAALVADLLERVRADPEIVAAGSAVMTPFRGRWTSTVDLSDGEDGVEESIPLYVNSVGPGYFEAMGIPLLAGRDFETGDTATSDPVFVVNQAAASALWPEQEALGQRFPIRSQEVQHRVIGVVADTNYYELGESPQPIAYMAGTQMPFPSTSIFAAARTRSSDAIVAVQRHLSALAPGMPVASTTTMEETMNAQVGAYRLGTRAVGSFAAVAVFLAGIGLYGVLAYLVSQGRREFGIRMALGDSASGIVGRVVGSGLKMAGLGILVGVGAALLLVRSLAGMLYGIDPHDPISFVAVPLFLVAIAFLASFLPARRAASVDPMTALRAD